MISYHLFFTSKRPNISLTKIIRLLAERNLSLPRHWAIKINLHDHGIKLFLPQLIWQNWSVKRLHKLDRGVNEPQSFHVNLLLTTEMRESKTFQLAGLLLLDILSEKAQKVLFFPITLIHTLTRVTTYSKSTLSLTNFLMFTSTKTITSRFDLNGSPFWVRACITQKWEDRLILTAVVVVLQNCSEPPQNVNLYSHCTTWFNELVWSWLFIKSYHWWSFQAMIVALKIDLYLEGMEMFYLRAG